MNALPAGLPDDFSARLVTGCPDAVIYADAQGRIRFWNEAATRIFGYREAEALGQSLDLIIPERLRDRHWQGYEHVMKGGASRSVRRRRSAGGAGAPQGRAADLGRIHDPAAA